MPKVNQTGPVGLARIGRALLSCSPTADTTDTSLLSSFLATADPEAFAQLVARHGPMVYAVCRRATGDSHLADDAFQATFLVLLRRAAAVRPRSAVRSWLYGVAVRTAREARIREDRRTRRMLPMPSLPDRPAAGSGTIEPDEFQALDEEIALLPERLRAAVVLCELDGLSRKDAAVQLGIPEGTLSSRLATARKRLAARLRERGVVIPSVGLGVVLGQSATRAVVPPVVADATARLATSGSVPTAVSELARGIFRSVLLGKLRATAIGGVVLGTLLAAGFAASPVPASACHRPNRIVSRPTAAADPIPAGRLTPVAPTPPVPPKPPAPEPEGAGAKLAAHLAAWERHRQTMTSAYAKFELTSQEPIFRKEESYTGSVLHMQPNLTRLRIDNVRDGHDYEAYICNGKSIYQYDRMKKTVTEFRLPDEPTRKPAPAGPENPGDRITQWFNRVMATGLYRIMCPDVDPPFMVLSKATVQSLQERYVISLFKEDKNYVYLDFKPRTPLARTEVEQIRTALFGPGTPTPYAPAQVWFRKPNGETELWTFRDVRCNLPGLGEKLFQYQAIPGWKLNSPPPAKPGG